MNEWWRSAFSADYLDVYAHRDDAQAAAEIAALAPLLREVSGPILDAACGNGRHLAELRRLGFQAFGFDFSAALLARASERGGCRGRLLRSDMRFPALASGWGAIVMLFTAFGYFDDAGNAACLSQLSSLLATGGLLILDQPDPEHVARNLVPESRRQGAVGEIVERRRIADGRIEKEILIRDGGTTRTYLESVRLYSRDELPALARQAGLTLEKTWSSLRGPQHDDGRLLAWFKAGIPSDSRRAPK